MATAFVNMKHHCRQIDDITLLLNKFDICLSTIVFPERGWKCSCQQVAPTYNLLSKDRSD